MRITIVDNNREDRLPLDESVGLMMERLSEDPRFLMCNRSTMVNMDHIAIPENHDFLLSNGEIVPIRQRGRAALKRDVSCAGEPLCTVAAAV